jgi:hypothetical protein
MEKFHGIFMAMSWAWCAIELLNRSTKNKTQPPYYIYVCVICFIYVYIYDIYIYDIWYNIYMKYIYIWNIYMI